MPLIVRMFSTRRNLGCPLALVFSEPFRSSHFRYFLLLRHFVLKFASPRHKGNFHSDIKTYRKKNRCFLCVVLCSVQTIAPLYIVPLYSLKRSSSCLEKTIAPLLNTSYRVMRRCSLVVINIMPLYH